MNLYDYIRYRRETAVARHATAVEWQHKLELIKKHRETVVVRREDFKQAFDFIDSLYPQFKEQMDNIVMYRNHNTYFCKNKLGLNPNAAGLFLIKVGAILLCWNNGEVPEDVVVVHEVLHYISSLIGTTSSSVAQEEDFAYRRSIPYLRQLGYDDEFITEHYLMGYCMSVATQNATPQPTIEASKKAIKKAALAMAADILKADFGEVVSEPVPVEEDPFDVL